MQQNNKKEPDIPRHVYVKTTSWLRFDVIIASLLRQVSLALSQH